MITRIKRGRRIVGPGGLGTVINYDSETNIIIEYDDRTRAMYSQDPNSELFKAVYEVNLDPKYLKIPNICFSHFPEKSTKKRRKKYSQQRIKNGFDDSETWCLDFVIAQFIVPRLEKFIELSSRIIDKDYDEDEIQKWKNIDIVLEAFKLLLKEDMLNKQEDRIVKKGLNLFPKVYHHLWW